MGVLNYTIKASELDERFLAALKALFGDAEIVISVQKTNKFKESKGTLPEIVDDKKSSSLH